ncbi:MAG: hypothetical protein FWD44_06460 [Oscillospiraceae bacterium]|nr:hypothetical protein [Oscillospiraceae bacterium]
MFNIINAGITPQRACEMYLNDYIVMLIVGDIKNDTTGDVIFVGSIDDRRVFVKNHTPPDGLYFYMLRGDNFREYCPIVEDFPCYSN